MDDMEPRMVYLDHAATSWPKPPEVLRETARALTELVANAGRSGHRPSLDSARLVFQTRTRLADLLGAARAEDVVFTRGSTEGLNLVLKGLLQPGDRVAVSPLEHNSVMRPLERLRREREIVIETLPADPFGRIDLEAVRRLARTTRFALLSVAHASNVNGVVQDLAGLRDALPETPILVDAAQTAGVLPIDVAQPRIDFLACSAHKGLLGPAGVGVCYLSPGHELPPLCEGGTGSRSESFEHPTFRPDRYEAGTLNLPGIAGTFGSLAGIRDRGLLGDEKRRLSAILVAGLDKVPGLRLHSPKDGSCLCVSFTHEGLSPDEVARRLERGYGVCCRPGLQCAPAAHHHLGTFPAGTVRLSPGWGNTDENVETVVRAVYEMADKS
jgi:cysteine desulfurase/selenocysteine lyase